MRKGMRFEMFRASKESHKDHLGADVGVDGTRHEKTRKGDGVRDFFHDRAGGTEGRIGEVLTTKVVDDDADGEVGGGDDRLAGVESSVVLARVAHFFEGEDDRGKRKKKARGGKGGGGGSIYHLTAG